MKKLNEIKKQIAPALEKAEAFRLEKLALAQAGKKWYALPIVIAIIGGLSLMVGLFPVTIVAFILGVVSYLLIRLFKVRPHIAAFEEEYKAKVLRTFMQLIYPNVHYDPASKISTTDFRNSELFGGFDNYYGEDFFSGTTEEGYPFRFSELNVESESTDSEGDTTTSTVFDGMFFVIETPSKNTNSRVHIVPDTAEKMMGFVGKFLQKSLGSLFQGAKMVYMEEHPEFEKDFVVYAKNEEEAYKVLTPAMIAVIYNLKYEWNAPLRVSFIENKIYVGMSVSKNYFHAKIDQSLLEDQYLGTLYNELALCFGLIESFSELENRVSDYNPSNNWKNSAYNHLQDSNNPFLM